MAMKLKSIDGKSEQPLHEQVRRRLSQSIAEGHYETGDCLPSESVLCRHFGVSRITVRQALASLASEGMLIKRQGKGTFVAEPAPSPHQRVITLVLANALGSFMSLIIRGVESVARREGFELNLCISHDDIHEEQRYIEQVIDRRVAGVLIYLVHSDGEAHPNCYHYLRIREAGIPLLFVDRFLGQLPIGYVVADDVNAMRALTEHMLRLGYRDIGYIDRQARVTTVLGRRQGFRSAMKQANLEPALIVEIPDRRHLALDDDADLAAQAISQLLASGRKMPRALVGLNSYFAIGAYRALRDAGLRVPEDVALAGYGDLPEAGALDVPLTVMDVPIEGMGLCATEHLVQLIRTRSDGADLAVKAAGQLLVRQSCGAPESMRTLINLPLAAPAVASNPESDHVPG